MIGTRLGNWVIDKELGKGGMGRVYLAHREPPAAGLPAQAAVKVLAAELAREDGFLHRFGREIEALRLLDHPNIVRFYESGEHDGRYYYAMEYVDGQNLEEVLLQRSRLPWKEVLDMALQVCPALKHAHDHGIIHRDLKTQNLMRTGEGVVKLTDFGVAKVFAARHLTATGGLVGTAEYISPEQAAGKPVTVRSDLYSFGVVLYTLLTGREPFQGETVLDLMQKHRYARCDPPRLVVPELPHQLDEIVCALLEKEPAKRPASALALQRQLESLRRKMDRKEQRTVVNAKVDATVVDTGDTETDRGPGVATLTSMMVRGLLSRENAAGPLARAFNHPAVLVTLFILCVGLLAWGLWPASAAALYARGAELMGHGSAADWELAFEKYFEPLERKYPDHPYQEQVREYRQWLEDARAERQARARDGASEAQRFYLQGKRYSKDGDLPAAQRTWQDLVTTFQGVESEQRWVRLAEKGLEGLRDKLPPAEQRWASVRAALERARTLPKAEAEKVWQAVEDLYRDDPSARPVLEEVRKCRAGQ
jgi:serine/threonine-protein kinase